MKVFVGFGYNQRDAWIEEHVFPIMAVAGFTVVHGKGMQGQQLSPGVTARLDQSDAAVGFFTQRDGQGDADFTSHIWVRDEMVYAVARNIPVVPIKEAGVKVPDGLLGNRQYIPLDPGDRLACVSELMQSLGNRNMRRIRLDPTSDALRQTMWISRKAAGFVIRYRTQDMDGLESAFRDGRLELVDQGFYLNVIDLPRRALVEVEGLVNGALQFTSGWVSADAVQVKVS
jgi:hypothetical protein